MNEQKKPELAKIPKAKRILFNIILLLLPFIILIFLEIILRIVNYGDNLKLFIDFPGKEMQEYKIDLQIDRNNLDEECIRQPVLFDQYAQVLVPLYTERDNLKLVIEQLSAQLDGIIRESASAEGKKLTEAKIQGEIIINPQYQNLQQRYILICTEVKEKEAIRDAIQQKKDMLKLLIELYISGYWATVTPKVVKNISTNALENKLKEKILNERS